MRALQVVKVLDSIYTTCTDNIYQQQAHTKKWTTDKDEQKQLLLRWRPQIRFQYSQAAQDLPCKQELFSFFALLLWVWAVLKA